LPASKKTKTKTGYSTSAEILEELAKDYEIAKLMLEQRHLTKLKSTYIDALPEMVNPKDNRIHTSFNQTITTTGRLSSSNPNLQNIPIRTPLGNRIRACFTPEDKKNSLIVSADYSQIELRLLAHLSKDEHLTQAFLSNQDIHTATAAKIFDIPLNEVTKEMRRKAKAVNFGIVYGQSSFGLSEVLDITPFEAREFIDRYFDTYPKVKQFMEQTKELAYQQGFVETMYGRKRYLKEELSSKNRNIRDFAERAAINTPLQGSAADLIKLAMIDVYKKLTQTSLSAKMILQVHDELVFEVSQNEKGELIELVTKSMELNQPLSVPLVIDIQQGASWMETEEQPVVV
jgi:DNA polymerase-1